MTISVKCSSCGAMSTEADFCSSCGTQLTPDAPDAGAAVSGTPAAPTHHETCPKCSAERDDPSSPFCGTCGYNFVTKQGGDVVPPEEPAPAAPAPVKTVSTPTAAPSASQAGPRMDIVITVDFNKPNAPKVRPSLSFPLFDEESLIGRQSSSVKQTVAIEDDAISKRHAIIVRNHDGSYVIRDLNSTNGTQVNGSALKAGADQPLKEGDVITMGEFTVITVQTIRKA
jgi:ribosomal protein L37E